MERAEAIVKLLNLENIRYDSRFSDLEKGVEGTWVVVSSDDTKRQLNIELIAENDKRAIEVAKERQYQTRMAEYSIKYKAASKNAISAVLEKV